MESKDNIIEKGLALHLDFNPEDPKFMKASREYEEIWDSEGARIVQAVEHETGLNFQEQSIKALVYEGISKAGYKESPMKLRASYSSDTKKATLIHELGHRIIAQIKNRPEDLDEHKILFLFLYDVWRSLYGTDFANHMVAVESKRRGVYDYESAWKWAMSSTVEERKKRFQELVTNL